tara:strand:+ start:30742 stop:31968 length:1227 start_codon:yes stop_codon:yes gene_type:complete
VAGGQQSNDTLYENGIGWALMLIIFGVLVWLFWVFFDTEVRDLVRWIRYGEMWLVSWFLPSDYMFKYGGSDEPFFYHLEGYGRINGVAEYTKQELNYDRLAKFSAMAMQPLKTPIVLLMGAGALWCMFNGPGTRFRRKLGLEELIEVQSKVFPVITPFVKFNPAKQPPRPPGAPVPAELPLFAEALGPEEWLAYNAIQVPDGKIDNSSTTQAFTDQLGRPWRGSKTIDNYKQVLLAAFCLKAARKRVEAEDFLGRLARCWSMKGGLNLSKDRKLLSEARNVLKDKNLSGSTLAQANRHAFETTAMLRALQFAREEGGVLPSGQFVWLRAHDRNLWYALNNMGRQSYHMEALGSMSHFKAEKLTQRPIPVPKVEHAVDTIQTYMNSIKARPIPQLDYSKSKKRGVKKAV